uniref:C-type lectin domain family 4 member K-like isoform X2 n=1 Tax=Phascolarctos cinereus TaxID=38626 RepID=A0A6P5LFX2_PHACI|nr:C-type lectin domain family 4 member K-like isoform X2 [Phascolarctos cinereus]
MELDGIYENMTPRNSLPQAAKGLSQHDYNLAHRKPRIIYTALALLVLALTVALSAVTSLYLQVKTTDMISDVHLWKARLEKVNASIAALRGQNEILRQRLSEIYTVYKGSLYYFSCTEKPWVDAELSCISKGSHLTSVTSEDEQRFLYNKANGFQYWNGLNRREDKMTFHWTDGTLYDEAKTKEFWVTGEPNNDKNNEHCVHFSRKALKSWNDLNCESPLKFIFFLKEPEMISRGIDQLGQVMPPSHQAAF